MGMYTELNIGVQIVNDEKVIKKLNYMLNESDKDIQIEHPLFDDNRRWRYMLKCDSYYFDSQTDSKLYRDDLYKDDPMYFLNVRCNLKNYNNEIKLFFDWLCPYIMTDGLLGYMRYEDAENPTLIYKENGKIVYEPVTRLNKSKVL